MVLQKPGTPWNYFRQCKRCDNFFRDEYHKKRKYCDNCIRSNHNGRPHKEYKQLVKALIRNKARII
jgi:hypothetical protein